MFISLAIRLLKAALTDRYGEREASSIAAIVAEDALGRRPGQPDRELTSEEQRRFEQLTARLQAGEPLQYVLGQADFYGMKLEVNPEVLIPRQETEELVAWVLSTARQLALPAPAILDVGTGSGCIALAIQKKLPYARVCAWDVSEGALDVARRNGQRLGLAVAFEQADVLTWRQLPRAEWNFIVSNPPYIPRSEAGLMPEHVMAHEPHLALFVDDPDPLLFYRAIMALAAQQLSAGGWLFFECNEFNAHTLAASPEAAAFEAIEIRQDLSGKDRMWRGRKSPATTV